MSNKTYYISSAALLVLGALFFWLAILKCKEPTELDVAMAQLQCAQSMDLEKIYNSTCTKVTGSPDCELTETDRPALIETFKNEVDTCAKAKLEEKNLCTDNYKGI